MQPPDDYTIFNIFHSWRFFTVKCMAFRAQNRKRGNGLLSLPDEQTAKKGRFVTSWYNHEEAASRQSTRGQTGQRSAQHDNHGHLAGQGAKRRKYENRSMRARPRPARAGGRWQDAWHEMCRTACTVIEVAGIRHILHFPCLLIPSLDPGCTTVHVVLSI